MSDYDPFDLYDREDDDFRDPGGRSALRTGELMYPCPDCGRPNMLTERDVQHHYCCDECADKKEGRIGSADY